MTVRSFPEDAAMPSALQADADASDGGRQKLSLIVQRSDWNVSAEEIMALRFSVAPELGLYDADDEHAPHFLAYRGSTLVGAVRVNFANESPLDFESILRVPVPEAIRPELMSVSRLVVARQEARAIRLILNRTIREACLFGWPRGCRASLVSCPEPLVQFYARTIGLSPIAEAKPHPRTSRLVRVMQYVPQAGGSGVIDDIVADLPGDPISPEFTRWLRSLREAVG